ncbi:putative chromatin regulator PHD family [Arabidopsis thaliana]|uniref:DC1 n=1 Tax=Arabidopsis thaliana x Arabidopsis arenosa TaxID=1240361 RepID=A0A8T2FJN7_9BRAS|nr:DC1 [Arabidopsis thaliana x Arabidopsis arenosa]
MDLFGEFHKVEFNGKPFLVYRNVIKPLPQTQTSNSFDKQSIDSVYDLPPQPLFLCPRLRTRILLNSLDDETEDEVTNHILSKYSSSPLFDETSNNHHVLPLFWCNNKEVDPEAEEGDECYSCSIQTIGTDYYFCATCDKRFHKECVECPLEISYPTHTKHSLQLFYSKYRFDHCIYCRKRATYMIYFCALCDSYMHVLCAQSKIPFFIDQPKRHNHTLTLFPRQASLTCNICGLINKLHFTYVCPICDFVAHSDCIYIPQTIRISRHHHRVSFISSLPFEEKSCGVCRQMVDSDYGAYTCNVCSGYVVHVRCALRKDIWDGKELAEVPEELEDVESFRKIANGVILHFSHRHHLKFDISGVFVGNKFCQACVLPINEGNVYVCVECDFILHETCAYAPRKKVHPLHPHPLTLKVDHGDALFQCSACMRKSNGFGYDCTSRTCYYILDAVCASTAEPFNYQGHRHPLFLSLDPKDTPMCHICKSTKDKKVLNCIECDFIICFECATLPYMVRYKHDEHYLTFCHGDEVSDSDWCELCEGKLSIGGKEGFYNCKDCCTTLHINCLLGPDQYYKAGQTYKIGEVDISLQHNNSASRPICCMCNIRCPYPIFLVATVDRIAYILCSSKHLK